MTDAVKKYREPIAYGLLGVAALYLLSGLSLLFKSSDDFGLDFSGRASAVGYVFSHPVLVISLAVAVALVVAFGEPSRSARTVVTIALGLGAVCLFLGVVCWFAAFGSDDSQVAAGVFGAGKVVGIFLGLAQLVFLALALLFAYAAFSSLPQAARATAGSWSAQPQPYGQPGWGQQPQGYSPQAWSTPEQAPWGQPEQPAAPAQGWGQQPGWGQPAQPSQQQGWGGAAYTAADAAASSAPGGWPDQPAPPPQTWGPPSSEQPPAPPPQGWGQQPERPAWGPSTGSSAVGAPEPAEASPETPDGDSENPDQQPGGWWQQPRS